jgi:PAS domain S-box-containing protein
VDVRAQILRTDEQGNVVRLIGVVQDITERKRIEERLRRHSEELERQVEDRVAELTANAEQLRLVVENIPAMVVHYDRDLVCRFANRHYAENMNRSGDALLGRHIGEILDAQYASDPQGWARRALAGEIVRYERERGGRVLDVTLVPYREPSGSRNGYFGFASDITELKHGERALRASEDRLRRLIDLLPESVFVKDRAGR